MSASSGRVPQARPDHRVEPRAEAGPQSLLNLPLVVDLDGTLTPSDTLVESVLRLLKRQPWQVFSLLLWMLSGPAGLKSKVAARVRLAPTSLPWRDDLITYLAEQRKSGRRLILATAAHSSVANDVAAHLGLFETVLATDGSNNLKGTNKLVAIRQCVGGPFVYAGDSRADLAVWKGAAAAVLVATSTAVGNAVRIPIERSFVAPSGRLKLWVRAVRAHQWVKNLLIFVPLFTSFSFGDIDRAFAATAAFVAFSLAASATYIFNDLWDLESDRGHPRKRQRPFASGDLSLVQGMGAAALLLPVAFGIALLTSGKFALMLGGYVVLTTLYSWTLKQYVLLDVLVLAGLYTWRVLAGSVAVNISVSPWLLAFSIFTFFSLALVKRCAELMAMQERGQLSVHGRDYSTGDLVVLWPLGVGSSLCSVVVFGLFVGSPGAELRYGHVELLWSVGFCLLYWITRLWVKTARGEMHDDPVVFAMRDFGSRIAILAMLLLTLLAHLVG